MTLFQREGQHLIVRVPITYSQAALGATIEVPTLDGPHELSVPTGTQSGEVFKLRGRACPVRAAASVGDLLVQVNIEVPKKLESAAGRVAAAVGRAGACRRQSAPQEFLRKVREFFGEQ